MQLLTESAPRKLKNSSQNRSQINKNPILGRKWSFYKLHWLTLGSSLVAAASLLAPFGQWWSTLGSTLLSLGILLSPFWCHWTRFWLHLAALGAILPPLLPFWFQIDHFGFHVVIIWRLFGCNLSLLEGVGVGVGEKNSISHHTSQNQINSAPHFVTGTVRTCFATWIT